MTEKEGGNRTVDTAVKKIFGNKLMELRKKAGVTRAELAEKLGIARVSISGWENGLRFPTADKLIELAEFFNVSLDKLLGRDEVSDNRAVNRYRFDRAIDRLSSIGKIFYRGGGGYALVRPKQSQQISLFDFDPNDVGMVKNIDEGLDGIYFENAAALYNFVENIEKESLNSEKTFETVFNERAGKLFVDIESIKTGQVIPAYVTNSNL